MTSDSDEILMGALAGGNDLALNDLMNRWQAPLRGFLYRYTQNEHDACDLAQEAFVRIYQQRARFRQGARFSTWMFQIALNLARSRARWSKRHPTASLDDESTDTSRFDFATESSPSDSSLEAEKVTAVKAAIAALPPDLREVVILAEYAEKTHAEIALIAETTAKGVESRLYRARKHLRQSLGKYFQT
jgi:RNA polymerase sigma-70 factor (ECF subfamily)